MPPAICLPNYFIFWNRGENWIIYKLINLRTLKKCLTCIRVACWNKTTYHLEAILTSKRKPYDASLTSLTVSEKISHWGISVALQHKTSPENEFYFRSTYFHIKFQGPKLIGVQDTCILLDYVQFSQKKGFNSGNTCIQYSQPKN